jgi:hypothetical protein
MMQDADTQKVKKRLTKLRDKAAQIQAEITATKQELERGRTRLAEQAAIATQAGKA